MPIQASNDGRLFGFRSAICGQLLAVDRPVVAFVVVDFFVVVVAFLVVVVAFLVVAELVVVGALVVVDALVVLGFAVVPGLADVDGSAEVSVGPADVGTTVTIDVDDGPTTVGVVGIDGSVGSVGGPMMVGVTSLVEPITWLSVDEGLGTLSDVADDGVVVVLTEIVGAATVARRARVAGTVVCSTGPRSTKVRWARVVVVSS